MWNRKKERMNERMKMLNNIRKKARKFCEEEIKKERDKKVG